MKVQHPREREDVPGKPPAKIDIGGEVVPVDRENGATFYAEESFAERLAARFDLGLADVRPGATPDADESGGESVSPSEAIERGECPWCDDYTGEHVGQHASSAHPDEWDAYNEPDDEESGGNAA